MRGWLMVIAMAGLAIAALLPPATSDAAGATGRVEPASIRAGGPLLLILEVTSGDLVEATVTPRIDCQVTGPAGFSSSPCAQDLGLAEAHVLGPAKRQYIFSYTAPDVLGVYSVAFQYHGLVTLLPQTYEATAPFQVVSSPAPTSTSPPPSPQTTGTTPPSTGPSGTSPSTGPSGTGPAGGGGPGSTSSTGAQTNPTDPNNGSGPGRPAGNANDPGAGNANGPGRPGPEPTDEPSGGDDLGHALATGPPTLGMNAFRFYITNSIGVATLSGLLVMLRLNLGG